MNQTETRKWTVQVTVAGVDVTDLLAAHPFSLRMRGDTLADVRAAGTGLAAHLIKEDFGSDASVVAFKQLKGDAAPVRDRSWYVYRDTPTRREPDGIRVHFTGA